MSEEFTFFWNGPYSQWHPSVFMVNEMTFSHAEQFMMYSKAALFQDKVTARKIMKEDNPRKQKALGREVKSFDKDAWSVMARPIVKQGNLAKFSQNPNLLELLAATAGTTLVEASPYDDIWGIGLGERDPRCLDRTTWKGTNWLGEILTEVRIELCGE